MIACLRNKRRVCLLKMADSNHATAKDIIMLKLAFLSLVIAGVLALLGFGGAAGTFVGIAKILFFIALALFALFLVLGIVAGRKIRNSLD